MRRRDFIGGTVGVATAVAVTPRVMAQPTAAVSDVATAQTSLAVGAKLPDAPPPFYLFAPLTIGSVVSQSLKLLSVSPITQGGFTVELGSDADGVAARISVCRASPAVEAVATTRDLALLVVNGGHGRQQTNETVAKAIVALASVMKHNEDRAAAGELPVETYEARVKHFGADVIG